MLKQNHSTGHKYIYYCGKDDRYCVQRRIKGKLYTYGRFETLEEAIKCKKYFQRRRWEYNDRYKRKSKHPYITHKGNRYYIIKTINGTRYVFGSYDNLEEAEEKRDEFIKNNWSMQNNPHVTGKRHSKGLWKLKQLSEEIKNGGEFYVK